VIVTAKGSVGGPLNGAPLLTIVDPSNVEGLAAVPQPDAGIGPALHGAGAPPGMNALSLMLTRRYRTGGGSLPYFGSHRIRHGSATLMSNNGMPLDELSRYLGHSSTDVTRRYARQTPETLGARAAEALARAGVTGQ
jgi:integrase